jgi:glycosyltransferase XagB
MNLPISCTFPEALLSGGPSAKLAPPVPLEKTEQAPAGLPAALAFLTNYGVSADELIKAALQARRQGVPPEAALLASGANRERFYYRCLAYELGAQFTSGPARISDAMRYPYAIHAGLLPLEDGRLKWLAAPQGRLLDRLLARPDGRQLSGFLAITTPSHLSRLARSAATPSILRDATLGLARLDPDLSAKTPPNKAQRGCAMAGVAGTAFAIGVAPGPALVMLSLPMSCLFLASVWLRLFAGAASSACCTGPFQARIEDRRLPYYSIVVALYREAPVVRQLIGALDALDYPRAKLDIKLVIEQDDFATCRAIEALQLPANYETVVAPKGWPKTKPRALNIALPQLRGDLAVVYDAEDIPAPGQLREAAERFVRAPRKLACLQARLAIDNSEDSWLTRLFAIEYSVLFDVLNPGYAGLGLPVPLGGSSNHFRTEVLRDLCGWDAWNVTEDADLGLRLARFGYGVGILSSTTEEEAPAKLATWLKQRRRWSKGWMQTFITLTRDPWRLVAELGVQKSIALGLMMTNMVVAPPLWPFFTALVVHQFSSGALQPASPLEVAMTVLWMSAVVFGAGSNLWLALLGMNRRRLMKIWPFLPLVPLYYLLASVASWLALYDLISRPYHWHKTEHGLAKTTRQTLEPRITTSGLQNA